MNLLLLGYLCSQPKLHPGYILELLKSGKKTANFDNYLPSTISFRIHDLRHIYVTIANESNIPMNEISRHVGHDDVKITQKVYLSIPEETQRESAAKVGKTIAEFLNDTNYNDKNAV